jgi:paraquat-inducible protein A
MMKLNRYPAVILSVLILTVSIVFVVKIRQSTNYFKTEQNKIVSLLNFNERLLDVKEAIPLYGDWVWSSKYQAYHDELREARAAYDQAKQLGYFMVASLLIFMLAMVVIYRKNELLFGVNFALLISALVMLTAGLFTPLLELEAYKENLEIKIEVDAGELLSDMKAAAKSIPFVGGSIESYVDEWIPGMDGQVYKWHKVYPDKMYFFYENKGLFDILSVLWKTNNVPIAIIVGLCSFFVPALKLLFSFFVLLAPNRRTFRFRRWVNFLTKFSMLDVMVVSIFLTYFTFDELSTGVETSSKLMMGVYYFAGYVLLAVISGYTLDAYTNKRLASGEELKVE